MAECASVGEANPDIAGLGVSPDASRHLALERRLTHPRIPDRHRTCRTRWHLGHHLAMVAGQRPSDEVSDPRTHVQPSVAAKDLPN